MNSIKSGRRGESFATRLTLRNRSRVALVVSNVSVSVGLGIEEPRGAIAFSQR